jgi:hypothetical protein
LAADLPQVNQAASFYEHDKASYYTNDAEAIIADTKIRLVFISLNMRATRSASSRRWRRARTYTLRSLI